jgi:hypothetical protein
LRAFPTSAVELEVIALLSLDDDAAMMIATLVAGTPHVAPDGKMSGEAAARS